MDTTAETLKPAVRATRDRLRAHFTSTALKATRTRKRGAADSVRPRKTSQVSARGDYPFGRMRGGAKGPELQCHVAHDDVQGVRAQIFFSFFSRPRRGEFPRRSRRGVLRLDVPAGVEGAQEWSAGSFGRLSVMHSPLVEKLRGLGRKVDSKDAQARLGPRLSWASSGGQSWAHSCCSKASLGEALSDEGITAIETDLLWSDSQSAVVHAHPPAKESDLAFDVRRRRRWREMCFRITTSFRLDAPCWTSRGV